VPNSENALKQYKAISKAMASSFPEDDMKTYSRESFSQKALEKYLLRHFQRMDLLPYIEGHHPLKLNSFLHSGNWFKQIGLPKESINYYKQFFDYYKKNEPNLIDADKYNYVSLINYSHSMLAENYVKLGLMDSAAVQHKINIEFAKPYKTISLPAAINNYGLFFYWYKKDLDSAKLHFDKAFEMTSQQFPMHSLLGSIRDNIADIYIDRAELEKAEPLYRDNFEFYTYAINDELKTIDVPRLISAGSQLVSTNLKLGHTSEALENLKKLQDIVNDPTKGVGSLPKSNLEFLKVKELVYISNGQIFEAYQTVKQYDRLSDSLITVSRLVDNKWDDVINNIALDRIKLKYEIDQIKKEAKIKSQKSKLLISSLISSIFIIVLLFIILRRRQHLINAKNKQLIIEQNLENSNLKVQQLNSEIKSKERDLSDFAINLIQNQEWASGLAAKMEDYKTAESSDKKELLNELEQVIKNKITFDEDTKLFFKRLDKLSDAFYSHLMTNYPNLSKNEIQLCSLIRLKMDSRSISTLQNITTASLNTSRYRLRKKLQLADDVNLDDFIQSL
jgi:tetratricopeptide (TPR) repeat protein